MCQTDISQCHWRILLSRGEKRRIPFSAIREILKIEIGIENHRMNFDLVITYQSVRPQSFHNATSSSIFMLTSNPSHAAVKQMELLSLEHLGRFLSLMKWKFRWFCQLHSNNHASAQTKFTTHEVVQGEAIDVLSEKKNNRENKIVRTRNSEIEDKSG